MSKIEVLSHKDSHYLEEMFNYFYKDTYITIEPFFSTDSFIEVDMFVIHNEKQDHTEIICWLFVCHLYILPKICQSMGCTIEELYSSYKIPKIELLVPYLYDIFLHVKHL